MPQLEEAMSSLPLANYHANFVHGADRSSSFLFSLVDASLGPSVAPLPSINNPPSDVHYVVKFRPRTYIHPPSRTRNPTSGFARSGNPGNTACRVKRHTDRTNQ